MITSFTLVPGAKSSQKVHSGCAGVNEVHVLADIVVPADLEPLLYECGLAVVDDEMKLVFPEIDLSRFLPDLVFIARRLGI